MKSILVIAMVFALNGCATLEDEISYHRQVSATSQDPAYLSGFSEGCESAYARSHVVIKAQYTRDEGRMRKDAQYAAGWEDGRTACNYPDSRTTFLLKRRPG